MKKFIKIGTIVFAFMMLVSCGDVGPTPDFLFRCTDFFGKNKKYYAIYDNQLSEISSSTFKYLTSGDDSEFEEIEKVYNYIYEVYPNASAPSEWKYV